MVPATVQQEQKSKTEKEINQNKYIFSDEETKNKVNKHKIELKTKWK